MVNNVDLISILSENADSDSENEEEDEFVPSIWDSTVQPIRSALKSPDTALDSSVSISDN